MSVLSDFVDAKDAIAPEAAAFASPVKPAEPEMTPEQHAIYRRGDLEGLVDAGFSEAAEAKATYRVAHAIYCKAKNEAGEALRVAKALVNYDEKVRAAQERLEALEAKEIRLSAEDEEAEALREALGPLAG